MIKRGATGITCVVLLIIGLVACGDSTQVDIPTSEAAPATAETAQDVTESLHTANQFFEWTDSLLPIAQVSITLDEGVNPDAVSYTHLTLPTILLV